LARGGGTRLVLIDELPPRIAARNAAGWEVGLERLAGDAMARTQPPLRGQWRVTVHG
jgi:hypothetical protein